VLHLLQMDVRLVDERPQDYGTYMAFDFSPTPSQTLYNKQRMKNWVYPFDRLARSVPGSLVLGPIDQLV